MQVIKAVKQLNRAEHLNIVNFTQCRIYGNNNDKKMSMNNQKVRFLVSKFKCGISHDYKPHSKI